MNKMKEVLHELKKVFVNDKEVEELKEVNLETEVITDEVPVEAEAEPTVEVELAEEPTDAPSEEPVVEEKVEYVTKLELQDFQRKIMELLEQALKPVESNKDVPQDLSADKVELAEETEEITHSPELEVEKKLNFAVPKPNRQDSIKTRVYKQLFG